MRITADFKGRLALYLGRPVGSGPGAMDIVDGVMLGVWLDSLGLRRSLAGLVIVNGAMVSASALDDHRLGEGDVVELHPPHAGG